MASSKQSQTAPSNQHDGGKSVLENVDFDISNLTNRKFNLPLKYWMPTLISVISGTALLIWFFFSTIINPLEKDIIEIKAKGITSTTTSPIVLHTLFLENTDGTILSTNQVSQIMNVVYKLTQRKDLVLLIAGYTDNSVGKDQFQKVVESKKSAERIKEVIVAKGIEYTRIYFEGFGQDVPEQYSKNYKSNVAILILNVHELMKATFNGGNIAKAI